MLLWLLLHPGAAFAGVNISGLDGALLVNARAHLSLDDEACDAPAWRVRRLFRAGKKEMVSAMQA
ncbi:MAG: outer membrane protein assembly factor, partial [Gammaproteobacteria bacterium]|nr:outer membrane protein assembly factor [Gammaproteobacteria bacterium]